MPLHNVHICFATRRELRRGVTWAISKQLELWLSTHELALSQREPAIVLDLSM
jgi:hypothetical protein